MDPAADQDILDLFRRRYAWFQPESVDAFDHRFTRQLLIIDSLSWIDLHDVQFAGNVTQVGEAAKPEQTLAPWKDRNDLQSRSQESFHRDETGVVGIAAGADDRHSSAVFQDRLSLPTKQIYPSRQVSGPIIVDLVMADFVWSDFTLRFG